MKRLLFVALCFLLVFGAICTANANDRWQWVTANDKYGWFFDTQSFQKINDNSYSIWIKQQYTEAFGKEVSQKHGFKKPAVYALTKVELDHKAKKVRFGDVLIYSADNEVLHSSHIGGNWNNIVPDSVMEAIYDESYKKFIKA